MTRCLVRKSVPNLWCGFPHQTILFSTGFAQATGSRIRERLIPNVFSSWNVVSGVKQCAEIKAPRRCFRSARRWRNVRQQASNMLSSPLKQPFNVYQPRRKVCRTGALQRRARPKLQRQTSLSWRAKITRKRVFLSSLSCSCESLSAPVLEIERRRRCACQHLRNTEKKKHLP